MQIHSEENVLDYDLAFSRLLLGKECARCRRAYPYRVFNKRSSNRDGYSNICPSCERAPKLSTAEHLSRYKETNYNSAQKERREDELDYLERDSKGRVLTHSEFIFRLRNLLGSRLIVTDAHFLNELSLYVEDYSQTDTNGVRYLGYIPLGELQEFSSYDYNQYGVPINESKRGYRGLLKRLIFGKYITEEECKKEFGDTQEKIWCKTMYSYRNGNA